MNNRRSYLDSMNAGRRRRAGTSLEELSHSLDELESRIRPARDDEDYRHRIPRHTRRLSGEAAYPSYDAHDRRRYARDTGPERFERRHAPDERAMVADELGALREDLRQQMSTGLRREFAALKGEIDRALQASAPSAQAAELGEEFERLSGMIHKLAERSDDRQINLLRLEMEQVKAALGKLAREDTVQSFDRRWDELDRRWSDLATQVSDATRKAGGEGALAGLGARLEQIGDAIEALPTSVSLRSLEDRLKMLASTVDQFAHQQDRIGPEALDAIEMRLDEITRALAASSSPARGASIDPEPFERIEARISALARQLGDVMEDNPAAALADQLAGLSHRVEDLAHRVEVPDRTVERLAGQIEAIARKLDQGPVQPDLHQAFHSLEDRFASLSSMLEQRQEDALLQGQTLFQDLERRLEDVAVSMQASPAPHPDDSYLIEAMDARFGELAARLERQASAPADAGALRDLEARLETISDRIETSTRQPGVDPALIRSLEAQIADLASHISQPAAAMPQMEDIKPRLDKIEQSIAAGRQDVLEAARLAAEEAVRTFPISSPGEGALVAALVDDLKALEQLNRKSDDRNAKTFEAIHDTLLKIVDRLGVVETNLVESRDGDAGAKRVAHARGTLLGPDRTPPLEPAVETLPLGDVVGISLAEDGAAPISPQAAAVAAAAEAVRVDGEAVTVERSRRSMLGGLSRAISGRKGRSKLRETTPQPETEAPRPSLLAGDAALAPSVELDPPFDAQDINQPLEPGSGGPDLNAIMKRVRDERGQVSGGPADVETAKSDFIAAARRAAQAAAAEAEMMKRRPAVKEKKGGLGLGGLLKSRRKPVLMGVAAILIALAALQFGKSFTSGSQTAEAPAPVPAPVITETAETEPGPTVRMADEEAPARNAGSMMMTPPETAAEIDADWLETTASLPIVPEAQAEIEAAAVAGEVALPEIPSSAGPAALREAAATGDAKALFEIGNRYAEGRGAAEDMQAAADWYERAAEQGLAPAQYRIGNLYEKGVGRERDVSRAKTWYQLAAAQGNASAMHNLAVLHAMGADGITDNESAARWFAQAAELGVRDSQFNLGILAAKGVGMEQNLEEAYKWFALVAKAGDKDAAEKRDEVANALRPEQLEKARAAADLWQAKAVDAEANTVEIPESWSESADTTASIGDMRLAIRNIQRILNQSGYDAGAEDGMMGDRTKRAIAAFQGDNGMAPTGEIDEKLVRALLERR